MIYGGWVTYQVAQTITGLSYQQLRRAVQRLGIETSKAGNTTMIRLDQLDKVKSK